jgi:HK97 family phage prohead protease
MAREMAIHTGQVVDPHERAQARLRAMSVHSGRCTSCGSVGAEVFTFRAGRVATALCGWCRGAAPTLRKPAPVKPAAAKPAPKAALTPAPIERTETLYVKVAPWMTEGFMDDSRTRANPGLPRQGTKIEPGAFRCALESSADIACLIDHDWSKCIASRKAGTLLLEERADGLYALVTVPGTVADHVRRGDFVGASWSVESGMLYDDHRMPGTRYIKAAPINEITLISRGEEPAFPDTWVRAQPKGGTS